MTVQQTISELDKVSVETKSLFSNLSKEQLNWKPTPEKWSIAQCLDHLIVSNGTYYPQLREVAAGHHKNSFYQNIKFISRFFGNYLVRETGPVISKPMKNPPVWTPSQSDLASSIITDFQNHQKEFSGIIQQLSNIDLEKIIISSPALSIITYSLRDVLTILSGHERRHLAQAKNVLNHPKFPK